MDDLQYIMGFCLHHILIHRHLEGEECGGRLLVGLLRCRWWWLHQNVSLIVPSQLEKKGYLRGNVGLDIHEHIHGLIQYSFVEAKHA